MEDKEVIEVGYMVMRYTTIDNSISDINTLYRNIINRLPFSLRGVL